jgi:hypothetical protein
MDYSAEVVDLVLWEVAVEAGNHARALRNLREREEFADPRTLPDVTTMRRWTRNRFRNRYHEIVHRKLAELDRQMIAGQIERALALDALEASAVDQIAGRIGSLGAVDASTVLRNVSGAKKVNVDAALALRRGEHSGGEQRGLMELARALTNLGVGTITVPDAEVVEEPVPLLGEPGGEGPPPPPAPEAPG